MQNLSDLLLRATFGPVNLDAWLRSDSFSGCNGIAPPFNISSPFEAEHALNLHHGNDCSLIRVWKYHFWPVKRAHSLGRAFNPVKNTFVFLPHLTFLSMKKEGDSSSERNDGRPLSARLLLRRYGYTYKSKMPDMRLSSWPLLLESSVFTSDCLG